MKVFSVTYDLKDEGRDYSSLYDSIQQAPYWWHYLESTWLIATNKTADQVFNRLGKHIDESDRVLVIRVTDEYSGWLPKDAWEWIRRHTGSSSTRQRGRHNPPL